MSKTAKYAWIVMLMTTLLPLQAQEMWQATRIETTVTIYEDLWEGLGFRVLDKKPTATAMREEGEGFLAKPLSELFFYAPGGDFEVFTGGIIYLDGGYEIEFKGETLSFDDFEIRTIPNSYHLDVFGPNNLRWFTVSHAHTHAKPTETTLTYKHGDLLLAPELANRLGLTPHIGQPMGILDMTVELDQPISQSFIGDCSGNFEGDIDVVLTELSRPFQRSSNGTVIAFSSSAELENQGTADVPWYNAIAPSSPLGQHPYLVQHMLMEQDGILRMIGQADVKHAFFSINSGCNCPGANILYVGCADVYGASTNVNQFYLGPREEVDPFTGNWESMGSHFDGDPVDNERDHGGSADHPDPTTHTMAIDPAMLDLPGARYWVEAWYVVQGDINIDNSFAYREVDPFLNGSTWTFSDVTASINQPGIEAWVTANSATESTERINTGRGQIHVSSKVTDLGGGFYRYAYALYNMDYNNGVQGVSIGSFEELQNVTTQFFDLDQNSENDWSTVVEASQIVFANENGNPLPWGTLYSVVVDSTNEPAQGQIRVDLGQLNPDRPNVVLVPAITPGESCFITENLITTAADWEVNSDIRDLVLVANDLCVSVQ
jgi:hypothetical protein